jgi:hypothetical protein
MRPTYEEIEAAYQGRRTQADEDTATDEEEGEAGEERKPKDTEEEEEPRRRRPSPRDEEESTDANPCPEGKRFGVDIDTMEACQKCDEWDPCVKEYKRLQNPEPPPQEDPPRRRLPRRKID